MTDPIRHAAESVVGAGIASLPFWLHVLNEAVALCAGLAGAVYAIVRGYMAIVEWRDWRARRRRRGLS